MCVHDPSLTIMVGATHPQSPDMKLPGLCGPLKGWRYHASSVVLLRNATISGLGWRGAWRRLAGTRLPRGGHALAAAYFCAAGHCSSAHGLQAAGGHKGELVRPEAPGRLFQSVQGRVCSLLPMQPCLYLYVLHQSPCLQAARPWEVRRLELGTYWRLLQAAPSERP